MLALAVDCLTLGARRRSVPVPREGVRETVVLLAVHGNKLFGKRLNRNHEAEVDREEGGSVDDGSQGAILAVSALLIDTNENTILVRRLLTFCSTSVLSGASIGLQPRRFLTLSDARL